MSKHSAPGRKRKPSLRGGCEDPAPGALPRPVPEDPRDAAARTPPPPGASFWNVGSGPEVPGSANALLGPGGGLDDLDEVTAHEPGHTVGQHIGLDIAERDRKSVV